MPNIFSLILTISTIITGIIWIFNICYSNFYFNKKFNKNKINNKIFLKKKINKTSIEYFSSVFPILITVFIIRSFILEPFYIPSSSMMPTLLPGDFILVKKFSYGIKNPITYKTFIETGKPKRGDISVFQYPKNIKTNFIKRIIGLPGDKITYNPIKKEIIIYENYLNLKKRKKIPIKYSEEKKSKWILLFENEKNKNQSNIFSKDKEQIKQNIKKEIINNKKYDILTIPENNIELINKKIGTINQEWIVPKKHYFVMGDNRDNSLDSRTWGFVKKENFIGKANFIWFSFSKIENKWFKKIKINRIGAIK